MLNNNLTKRNNMDKLSQNFEEYAKVVERKDNEATLRDWQISEEEKNLKDAELMVEAARQDLAYNFYERKTMERPILYDQFGRRDGEPADNYWEKPIPHAGIDPEARYLINVDPSASEVDAHDGSKQDQLKARSFLGILQ